MRNSRPEAGKANRDAAVRNARSSQKNEEGFLVAPLLGMTGRAGPG
jgi:hypothetical protein